MDLKGAIIGQYHIIEPIGKGGMATVYKAYQPNLDRYVAVKVLLPGLTEAKGFIARFERGARAVAKLRHRNILTVFDYGRQGDVLYLAMEYVRGGTLAGHLGWPQDLDYAVNIISQVGDALAYAHTQGMIHRDVKPGNILMVEEDWPLLSDFGLAKMVEDSLHITLSGASIGTPQYMSPEQAQGLAADRRSDIYSLGVVLYEAVTGRPPFGTDSPMAVILRHINEPLTPPHSLRSDLPEELERVILKALAKSPADRYQRMEEFLADLHEAYPLPARRPSPVLPHSGKDYEQAGPKRQAVVLDPALTPVVTPRLSRRRSFPWTGLAIGAVLLWILALTLLLFKASLYPRQGSDRILAGPTAQDTALPIPPTTAAVPSSAATLETAPSAAAPSPTMVPLAPVATDAVAVAPSPSAIPVTSPSAPVSSSIVAPTMELRVWAADGAEMVFVPAGEFVMGSGELGDDEQPVHRVYLDSFWIDRYEVTNERFARFVAATGYQTEAEKQGWGWVSLPIPPDVGGEQGGMEEVKGADWRHPHGPDSGTEGKTDHPVVLVSWNDADAYCRWAGKRLPTEAQWEKAARGTDERRYAWGDEFDSTQANTKESEQGDTTPVGSFSPQGDSPYGASDMTGNVWEWVADWYGSDYYSQAPLANPPGPATGTEKVLRGGSWAFNELWAHTAFRHKFNPDYTYDFVGFRCSNSQEQ